MLYDQRPDLPMIKTVDLRVDYGAFTAVHDLNLEIGRGEIFGMIGPNGAGKTSTIKVMATLLEPTYGEVYIGGFDTQAYPEQVHQIIGYMPDMAPVYDDLKVWEFMEVFAGAYFIAEHERALRVAECLDLVDLSHKRDAMAGELSRGMMQRLVLAKTMLHEPHVLLLDEPASGLDPVARANLRAVLRQLSEKGMTILISSHILSELTDMCTSIGIMQRGKLEISGSIREVITKIRPHRPLEIRLVKPHDEALKILQQNELISSATCDDLFLRADFRGTDEDAADILEKLIQAGVRVRSFAEQKTDVEDIFFHLGANEAS